MDDLQASVASKRIGLQTLQKELTVCERLLNMYKDLLEKADLIIVFETKHRNEITRVLDYNQWNKISLFNQLAFGENKDMEDPHMQSETIYKRIATQIEKGCEQLVQHMKMGML